ncbi:TfpX/TfpZ family type IV pilin accessory protein [Dokdonella sp.]|uniref:TfpX/TfpZ family type IV pilin accessory protein n=1 Tax=Dokdonella sp. TaxID=2291710 RepID=UPI0031C80A7B|nr:hypothetical protein [Dokdonella sp.]
MSRWKAAAIHASISAAIGVLAALLIFGLWYPPPYAQATGAPELVMLLLGVDLTLGPLLTLVVFKAGKKGMAFDLAVIGTLQACALVYGLHVVAVARPVYIVGAVDRFVLVTANELDPEDLAQAQSGFRKLPWSGPRIVGTKLPTNGKEQADLLFSALAGKDVEKFPKYYVPYAQVAAGMLAKARTVQDVDGSHPENAPALLTWLKEHSVQPAAIRVLPLLAPHGDFAIVLDAADGAVLDVLAMDLW